MPSWAEPGVAGIRGTEQLGLGGYYVVELE